MKHLFYLITFIFIWHELMWIYQPKKQIKIRSKTKKLRKEAKGKKWSDYTKDQKHSFWTATPSLITVSWMFLGLLTWHWPLFLGILFFNFTIIALLSKIFPRKSVMYLIVHWLNSWIGLCFGIFLLINTYHLKIDIWQIIVNYFK